MATTITGTITHHVSYSLASSNPITVDASGTILVSDGYSAMSLASGTEWTVTNNGTVASNGTGSYAGDGIDATLATITNTGLIQSSYHFAVNFVGDATPADSVLINSGIIQDAFSGTTAGVPNLYGAVYLHDAGSVTNQAGGLIIATHNGIFGIRGYHGAPHEQVTNMGQVKGGTYGIGTAGALTLANSGIISGGIAGVIAAAYGHKLTVNSGGSVINNDTSGLIEGSTFGVTVAGPGNTVINAGTISGASAAVLLARGYDNRLIDDPGAVFEGVVDGGNPLGSSATISTLELNSGSGVGTLTGLGVATGFTNFAAITVDAGASWAFSGTNTVALDATLTDSGNLTLAAGSVLSDTGDVTIAAPLAGAGTIALGGAGVTLAIGGGVDVAPAIAGFRNNTIALLGVNETIAGFAGGQLTLGGADAMTLAIAGTYNRGDFSASYSAGNTILVACFAEGSGITTNRGRVAVEALCVGDRVLTASGRLAPVRWLGHRRTNLKRHPSPHDILPVRVTAGAFGPGQPSRDLILSPDHAVFVDGKLVPIRYLINGRSIVQEARDAVTYWHVELDRHDVLLVEDLACESYLDTGNRAAFASPDGPTQLHPDFARSVWAEAGCAPILTDPADPTLRALHLRLLARAMPAAHRLAKAV